MQCCRDHVCKSVEVVKGIAFTKKKKKKKRIYVIKMHLLHYTNSLLPSTSCHDMQRLLYLNDTFEGLELTLGTIPSTPKLVLVLPSSDP